MPTAARLIAALGFALLGFILSEQIKPLMPEGIDFGYFNTVNAVLGFICGWVIVGRRAGRGRIVHGINNGLTGAGVLMIWGLTLQGAVEMFRLAHRNRYDGPFEAVSAIFTIALEYFFIIAVPGVLSTLVIGGAICGLCVEAAAKRWK